MADMRLRSLFQKARMALPLLLLAGCVPVTPPAPDLSPTPAPAAPIVQLHIPDATLIYPGDSVTITVEIAADGLPALSGAADDGVADQPVELDATTLSETVALRLAIDGADTGWRTVEQLAGLRLDYPWIAGDADSYELVAQARNRAGLVGEARRFLVVLPAPNPQIEQGSVLRATTISLPAYPFEEFQRSQVDPVYRWPYQAFDRDAFWGSNPQLTPRRYHLLLLENRYLQVSILPELGGRIWQVIHKPTGDTMFYQNLVVKPSPWGPANQQGWLGLGGLEWALPVNEHGYDWGTAWEVTTFEDAEGAVGVEIATPDDGRLLQAAIRVTLPPDRAYLTVAPTLRNVADHELEFHFWQTAMLAPGANNRPSADLKFVVPTELARVHSSGDRLLPASGRLITWPTYFGRDLSRLGNWDDYIGLFEYPAAHGPFVGVYDHAADAGAMRIFPASVAQGSKIFGLGWRRPIGSEHFTDDRSGYVELHGGLSPTFDEPYTLAAGAAVAWEEMWYPVAGIHGCVYANGDLALNLARTARGLEVGVYPTAVFDGTLVVTDGQGTEERRPVQAAPDAPFTVALRAFAATDAVTIRIIDRDGRTRLDYHAAGGWPAQIDGEQVHRLPGHTTPP